MIETVEKIWRQVSRGLDELDAVEREKARKLLIRRLRHPEAGASPGSTPEHYIHPKQGGGPMPRFDSPLCWCGATRAQHAEDGSYDPNGCPQFVSAR